MVRLVLCTCFGLLFGSSFCVDAQVAARVSSITAPENGPDIGSLWVERHGDGRTLVRWRTSETALGSVHFGLVQDVGTLREVVVTGEVPTTEHRFELPELPADSELVAVSAALDGEGPDPETSSASAQQFATGSLVLRRSLRISSAESIPDVAPRVLDELVEETDARGRRWQRGTP